MSTRYQELEQQIQTLQEEHQKQVKKLQGQVELLKKEVFEEQESKLPERFNRVYAINFLNNPNKGDLYYSFIWDTTPQGGDYWFGISNLVSHKVPEEAIIQVQKWVIQSYQQQYGN